MKKINSDEPDYNYLNWRLMAAVGTGNVRHVKAILALGADPSHRCFGRGTWSYRDPMWKDLTPGVFPLALVLIGQRQANQAAILDLLLAAGACLSTCFSWLSVDAPMKELRFNYMLEMCELIYASPNSFPHEGFIKWWLDQTSYQINQWPEPEYSEENGERDLHVQLHKRLGHVSKLYGWQHVAAPWATGEML